MSGDCKVYKNADIFENFKEKHYDIYIVCETHCSKEIENIWKQEWGYDCYFSSFKSNSRGVAILLNTKWLLTLRGAL